MSRALHGFGNVGGRALAIGLIAIAGPAAAQSAGPGPINPPPAERQGTIIGGKPTSSFERCVDVQIGNDGAFGCLNQKLRREVDKVNPSLNLPPVDARSSDVRVGNVNEAAVRQQYGSNYGRSAVPFRPSSVINVPPHR
ncbi:hypothetical protein [Bradyrhizobium betae]|uniref:hypothetical protein n=1 Tax=Bradyrhizobium betae TaxID=244734 RepID=UPI001FCE41B8|nr:hypothetical protein [Bradyrhizobium betae]MCS3730573.1 hypothetical protein [Bradyrhizobium betae]